MMSGCSEKAFKLDKINTEKIRLKSPLYGRVQIICFWCVIYIQDNFGVRLNFGKRDVTRIACNVEKLMLVAPKISQFPQNTQISLICFVSVFTAFQFSNICIVSYGAGDDTSHSIMGIFLKHYFWFVREMQEPRISLTGRIPYVTLQLTYPVWPRNGAFPQLLFWKQTFRNSKFEVRKHLLTTLPKQKIKFWGFLSILGPNVTFSSISACLFKTFFVLPHLPVKLTHWPHVCFFKLGLQIFENRPVVNKPAVALIQW